MTASAFPNYADDDFDGMDDFIPIDDDNPSDRCPIALVVDVSYSMDSDMELLNQSIAKYRNTVMADPVATLRVETALIAFNQEIEVVSDFCPIERFLPPPMRASGGTRICAPIEKALDMLEARKRVYRDSGIGYYRPWLFILTDGIASDAALLPATAARLRATEKARGVTTFVIAAGDARDADSINTLRQLSEDRVLPMKDAAYDSLLEWIANSTVTASNSGVGDQIQLPDPAAWLKVDL